MLRQWLPLLAPIVLTAACDIVPPPECTDEDKDGIGVGCGQHSAHHDCDDHDPTRSQIWTVHIDADEDGVGTEATAQHCIAFADGVPVYPPGYSSKSTDCDDNDASMFPGAARKEPADACRRDADGDGYGVTLKTNDVDPDCNDDDPNRFPGAALHDGADCLSDADGDGYGSEESGGSDCDDATPFTYPGAVEVADDGVDQDCREGDLTARDGLGIYVAVDDGACTDSGGGARTAPFCSLPAALAEARARVGTQVGAQLLFVAAGLYESATLNVDFDVHVVGGYDAVFERVWGGPPTELRVTAPEFQGTWVYYQTEGSAVLDGLHVIGPSTAFPGVEEYRGVAAGTGRLTILNSVIDNRAGRGVSFGVEVADLTLRDSVVSTGAVEPSASGSRQCVAVSTAGNSTITGSLLRGCTPVGSGGSGSSAAISFATGHLQAYGNVILLGSTGVDRGIDHWEHLVSRVTVANNTFIGSAGSENDLIVGRGTFINNLLVVGTSATARGLVAQPTAYQSSMTVWGNALVGDASKFFFDPLTNASHSPEVTNRCELAPCVSAGENFVATTAGFVDLSGGDYRLSLGSVGVDAGVEPRTFDIAGVLRVDRDGVLRPRDGDGDGVARWDIGAYER